MSEVSNMEKLDVRRRNVPGDSPEETNDSKQLSRSGDVSESDNLLDSDHVSYFLPHHLLSFVVLVVFKFFPLFRKLDYFILFCISFYVFVSY